MRSGHPLLAYKVIDIHTLNKLNKKEKKNFVKAEWLAGFIAFRFLDNKKNALRHFKNAYEASTDSVHKSKNSFWVAEVYLSLNNTVLAFDWYMKTNALFNTFYGQVALQRLLSISIGRFKSLEMPTRIVIDTTIKKSFYSRELVQVLKLITTKNIEKDVKFLSPFYKKLIDIIDNPEEEKLLLKIAKSEAEKKFIYEEEAKSQKYFSDKKLFKTLDSNRVEYIKDVNDQECFVSLVHAVIKRESMFNPNAKSSAGAIGLMQVMPTTADYEMRNIKFYTGKNKPLSNVQKNLTIGSTLLNRLLNKYNNNIIYALYAYNAGEGNLNKFKKSIKNLNGLTVLDQIELVPIKETRIYIKHVLYNLLGYLNIFNQEDCYNCRILGELQL